VLKTLVNNENFEQVYLSIGSYLYTKMMNKKQSSAKEATKTSHTLQNVNASKLSKSLEGSVLSQAKGYGKGMRLL